MRRHTSEEQLQCELDLPRGRCGIVNDPARGAVVAARENYLVREREIGMIQNVEQLGPELHVQSFTDSDPLQERRVHIEQARPTQRSARHVSERSLERKHERSRIKPSIGFSQNHRPFEIRIPARYVGITGIAGSGSIGASQWREGETACQPDAAVPLPAADQLVHDASGAASKAPPIPERQLIARVRIELVSETVGSDAARPLTRS
jgi:hypothetical protein